jgi:hypothetical protein
MKNLQFSIISLFSSIIFQDFFFLELGFELRAVVSSWCHDYCCLSLSLSLSLSFSPFFFILTSLPFLFFLFFWDRISLGRPAQTWTHDPPTSASWVLGLQACTTMSVLLLCCRRVQTETERAPKLLGSKFIKQASSNSADSSIKAEPQEQRGPSLYTI